jgi:DNA helicase-2/ATP-dependent DNA helicase PcrA
VVLLEQPAVIQKGCPTQGAQLSHLIGLANHLVTWNHTEHPMESLRHALSISPLIEPAPEDDPQPNPPDEDTFIHISLRRFKPADEVSAVADSLERWLPEHQDSTVAVLAPSNHRAFDLVDELKKRGLPYHDDLLRSSSSTRFSAGSLGHILRYLSDPSSSSKLSMVYKVWKRDSRLNPDLKLIVDQVAELLKKIHHIEEFIWPENGNDWLDKIDLSNENPDIHHQLIEFRQLVRRWGQAVLLPVDQIVLTIAQDILTDPGEWL